MNKQFASKMWVRISLQEFFNSRNANLTKAIYTENINKNSRRAAMQTRQYLTVTVNFPRDFTCLNRFSF